MSVKLNRRQRQMTLVVTLSYHIYSNGSDIDIEHLENQSVVAFERKIYCTLEVIVIFLRWAF